MRKSNQKIREKKKSNPTEGTQLHMVERPNIWGKAVDVLVMVVCGVIALCCAIPLWHVLMASLSDGKALMAHEGIVFFPVGEATLDAYKSVFRDNGIMLGYLNTIIYVVGATFFGMFLSITGGYVLSRQTRLKPLLTIFIILPVLFGGGLIPTYMVVRKLGMLGTRWALLIPGCVNAMGPILMMNGFNSVPNTLYEAARIDGAGHIRTMLQVMLPGAMNIGTVCILNSVIGQWNAWFNASIYLPNDRDKWPLQLWIRQITADNDNFFMSSNPDYSRYVVQFAVIVVATAPLLCVFPFFQEKLEKGIIGGGIKG